MEQRVQGTLQVWAEPFIRLRVPLIFNLRRDPGRERAQITSNTYYDWLIDRAYLLVPAQDFVGQFLATFREFPPRQKAASFSLDQVMDKLIGPGWGAVSASPMKAKGLPGGLFLCTGCAGPRRRYAAERQEGQCRFIGCAGSGDALDLPATRACARWHSRYYARSWKSDRRPRFRMPTLAQFSSHLARLIPAVGSAEFVRPTGGDAEATGASRGRHRHSLSRHRPAGRSNIRSTRGSQPFNTWMSTCGSVPAGPVYLAASRDRSFGVFLLRDLAPKDFQAAAITTSPGISTAATGRVRRSGRP